MPQQRSIAGRAAIAAQLFLCLLALAACGNNASSTGNGSQKTNAQTTTKPGSTNLSSTGLGSSTMGTTGTAMESAGYGKTVTKKSRTSKDKTSKSKSKSSGEMTVKGVLPQDVLPKKELTGAPTFSKWNDTSSDGSSSKLVPQGSSAGAIPNVKPFNFGRDPGGPKDKTLYLTIPVMGLSGVPVYNSTSEESLTKSTVHIPATGFPWQKGANAYIAGHRIGYTGTGSLYIFYDLDKLQKGDEILLKDSKGGEYYYKVDKKEVVSPSNVEVMSPVAGKSIVTLQTCTLPNYKKRLIIQGELVKKTS